MIYCSIGLIVLGCICFSCRKTIVNYSCCRDHSGLCYKCCFNYCLCYENCFKRCVCFKEDDDEALCYCYNCCFITGCALDPEGDSINQVQPVNHAAQQRQLYAPQEMPPFQSPLNQNQVVPGNPIVVNDNRIPIVPIDRPNAEPTNLIDSAYGPQYQHGMVQNDQNSGIPMQKGPMIPNPEQTIQNSTYAYQENNSMHYYPPLENINIDNQYQYPVIDPYTVNSNNINLED